MNRLMNKRGLAVLSILAVLVTVIAIPTMGTDDDYETLTLVGIESAILNDNIAIAQAELALDLAEEELDEAEDNKGSSGSSVIETSKNRRYYPKEADMNRYIAEQDLQDTIQAEVLSGTELYYNYVLLIKEISIKNDTLLRLEDELAGVVRKIELGLATDNDRTAKELEIANTEYELMLLQDEKTTLFLDMNLALQQDLATVLVIEEVDIPFEQYKEADLDEALEFLLVTDQTLYGLEKQQELDEILLDIYEDNNRRDAYDSNIIIQENAIEQADLEIADRILNIEYQLRSKYNEVLNGYDTVQIRLLELENLKLQQEILTKRFDVGYETENTVKAAEESTAAGELALMQAKLDYYVAIESFENFID